MNSNATPAATPAGNPVDLDADPDFTNPEYVAAAVEAQVEDLPLEQAAELLRKLAADYARRAHAAEHAGCIVCDGSGEVADETNGRPERCEARPRRQRAR